MRNENFPVIREAAFVAELTRDSECPLHDSYRKSAVNLPVEIFGFLGLPRELLMTPVVAPFLDAGPDPSPSEVLGCDR